MEWMLLPLKRYADFSGRSRRKEYWMFYLATILAFVAVVVVAGIFGAISESLGQIVGGLAYLVVLLGLIVPSIAVGVRRMHDTDHSGWWLLVPIANLVFAFTDGTKGPNRFGPDPKGSDPTAVFN